MGRKTSKSSMAILGMLSIEPMSAYAIGKVMQQSTAAFWAESDGQLYPALKQLEKEGLVRSKKIAYSTRRKKLYTLSTKGKDTLKKWLAEESQKNSIRNEFLLKLFFGANVQRDIIVSHIKKFQDNVTQQLELLKVQEEVIRTKDSEHAPYWLYSIQYGIQIAKAKLQWCRQVLENSPKEVKK